jgi:hypothetical protein
MQRYYRDASVYRSHLSSQYEMLAQRLGLVHLGLDPGMSTSNRGAELKADGKA